MTSSPVNDTISNAEITTYNTCQRQHYYAYNLSVQPKESPLYFYRGEWGHAALEVYYKEMQLGSPVDVCLSTAIHILSNEMLSIMAGEPEAFDKLEILTDLIALIKEYSDFYRKEPFRVIAVEEDFRTQLYTGMDYVMRLDLLVEFTEGDFRGDLAVIDHKFVHNFKNTDELELDGQLPKYIKTLQANGYRISKGFFNQIRHQKDAREKFQRTRVRTNSIAIDNIWQEQELTALRINMKTVPVRLMNPYTCKSCPYAAPCKAELNGDNIDQMLKANFKKREHPFKQPEGI